MSKATDGIEEKLQTLRSALPEKYDPEYEKHIDGYQYGFNDAINQVNKILTDLR